MTAQPISSAERAARAAGLFDHLPAQIDAAVLFDDQFIQYYSGFAFMPTERPIALVVLRGGERHLFVPRLEREHAEQTGEAEVVLDYAEYPGRLHPMHQLAQYLTGQGLGSAQLAVDHDGYPPVMGYYGPTFGESLRTATIHRRPEAFDHQMSLKSEAEVRLIEESIVWGNRAHQLLQRYTRVGESEHTVEARATKEATEAMTEALGPSYRGQNRWLSGAVALYRGQIGPASALPHATTTGARFQVGDILVTGAGAAVWGYLSELERTMVMGEPSREQQQYFQHMLNLQDIAFAAVRAGVTAASVDQAVQAYFAQEGLQAYWRHHVGHSLGQRIHESPFLDLGDDRILEAGMVLTIEPGLYVPGLGGFRHSDTILVTATGMKCLTDYPRDLESLIIPTS